MIDTFAWPWVFVALLLIPIGVGWPRRPERSGAVYTRLHDLRLDSWRTRVAWFPPALRVVALALLVVALARPQKIEGNSHTVTEGVAIQMVIDRSSSMEQPMRLGGEMSTRIGVTRELAKEFVGEPQDDAGSARSGDMIGLITFAGFADTLYPLSRSHAALHSTIDSIETARVRAEDGTAIGSGLQLAAARLKNAEAEIARAARLSAGPPDFTIKSKVIILLTDGAANRGVSPLDAAYLAAEWGIRVYTIGIGDTTGETQFRSLFSPVEVDRELLERIASITGGRYFSASDGDTLRRVYEQIDQLERSRVETFDFTLRDELFSAFAIGSLVALVLEIVLRASMFRRTA